MTHTQRQFNGQKSYRDDQVRSNSANKKRQHSSKPKNHKENFDRYILLAREATHSGNTIDAENYYQHAEHYFRLLESSTGSKPSM